MYAIVTVQLNRADVWVTLHANKSEMLPILILIERNKTVICGESKDFMRHIDTEKKEVNISLSFMKQ